MMKNELLNSNCSFRITTFAYFLVIICLSKSMKQTSYKAAVVEYAPKREFRYLPRQILMENTKEYIKLIKQAASEGADIIVFPEYGLTTLEVTQKVLDHLESYGIEMPTIEQNGQAIPCNNTLGLYHKVFIDLSCAAKRGNIYVVINVVEKETITDDDDGFNIYSSNFVFDRNGIIIKKYRKINLHDELHFNQGAQNIETFTTDFRVTFGLLIGADILHKNSTINLFKQAHLTDVIYSTSWCSETPFLQGLSIQHGYAKANQVNLLSASLNDPTSCSGGSGIFLADGTIADGFISGVKETKLLIQDISINSRRSFDGTCQEPFTQPRIERKLRDIGPIKTAIEDMQNYTFEPLDVRTNVIQGCSKNNSFCCYNITIDPTSYSQQDYTYKLVSFFGARNIGSNFRAQTIAVCVCAVVACLNENSTSCGVRNVSAAPKLTFKSISINVTFRKILEVYFQPTTLKYDLFPAIDYIYCAKNVSNSKTDYFVKTTNPQSSLLTFGVFGRIYDRDKEAAGALDYSFMKELRNHINSSDEQPGGAVKYYIIIIAAAVFIVIIIAATVFIGILCIRRKKSKQSKQRENSKEHIALRATGAQTSSSLNFPSSSNMPSPESLRKVVRVAEKIFTSSQNTQPSYKPLETETQLAFRIKANVH